MTDQITAYSYPPSVKSQDLISLLEKYEAIQKQEQAELWELKEQIEKLVESNMNEDNIPSNLIYTYRMMQVKRDKLIGILDGRREVMNSLKVVLGLK
jgi:hypothetical protein